MPSATYKLSYFAIRGRAEYIRLVLVVADIPFEDNRIKMVNWPQVKPTIPGGRLPVLEVTSGGETRHYMESMAIARWLAKQHGLMGKTDEEYYKIEKIIGQAEDADKEFLRFLMRSDDEKKKILEDSLKSADPEQHFIKSYIRSEAEKKEKLKESMKKLPDILNLICESLRTSGGKFVAGDNISFGDLFLIHVMDHMNDFDQSILHGNYPEIAEHRKNVLASNPKLAAYIASRPVVPF